MSQDSNLLGKFISSAALHGVSGHAFDAHRNRFANEWDRPVNVTGECYTGRGVMQFDESGATLAENMGVTVSKMQDSVEAHHQTSLKTDEDLDEGPFLACTSVKS